MRDLISQIFLLCALAVVCIFLRVKYLAWNYTQIVSIIFCMELIYTMYLFIFKAIQKYKLGQVKVNSAFEGYAQRDFSKISYTCNVCGCNRVRLSPKGTQTGIYCTKCGSWIQWVGDKELPVVHEYISRLENEEIVQEYMGRL